MFPCTKCGACCRLAVLAGLPPKEPGSLVCVHFNEQNNECSIYETRPKECRIDECGELFGISKEENHKLSAEVCNQLQEILQIDHSFRVNAKQEK